MREYHFHHAAAVRLKKFQLLIRIVVSGNAT